MSGIVEFRPKISRGEALDLAAQYCAAGDTAAMLAGRAIKGGDFSPDHLRTIFKWKTGNRGKKRLCGNSDAEIRDALELAVLAREPRSVIAVLCGLSGVDTPVASAIATVINPEKHTVLDFRALHALGCDATDRSISFYLSYRSYCLALAAQWKISPRTLDRALWQWSKSQSKTK